MRCCLCLLFLFTTCALGSQYYHYQEESDSDDDEDFIYEDEACLDCQLDVDKEARVTMSKRSSGNENALLKTRSN